MARIVLSKSYNDEYVDLILIGTSVLRGKLYFILSDGLHYHQLAARESVTVLGEES